jgi:phage terminase large subunit-like protein
VVDLLVRVARRMEKATADPRLIWIGKARPDQLLPPGEWRIVYWQGGRGSGKTASGAGALADWILGDSDGQGEYGIIAPTYADAWTKCVEGEAGLLQALGTSMAEIKDHRSATVRSAWRTYGQVILHSGIVVYIDSASEGGLRIQGRNLKGAWCDEIGLWEKWETAWNESLKYATRKGVSRIIATGTPKASRPARKLIRSLIRNEPEHGGVVIRRLRTVDNAANLSEAFMRAVVGAAAGTRLERQELEGELLDDVANSLWSREVLERAQCGALFLRRAYVGVDPSDGAENSDEQAYTISGLADADDPHVYVTENWGGQEAPAPFTRRVLKAAHELQLTGCDTTIILEKNHGGQWLVETFRQTMKEMGFTIKLRVIHASQAKRTRAEPVSAMYERLGGMVKHATSEPYVELEDQMATFTGAQGERSPDRLDSLVWSLSPFLKMNTGKAAKALVARWAAQGELDAAGGTTAVPNRAARRLAEAHNGAYAPEQDFGLDSFAPHDDDATPVNGGQRGNVIPWK